MGYANAKGSARVCSAPLGFHVAFGDITDLTEVDILGYSASVNGTSSEIATQAGAYAFMATKAGLAVVSDSANDTSAGTGAKKVTIEYLDENYVEKSITVTMNGITNVNTTPTDILRINKFYVDTVGTGGVAAGNITIKDLGGTVTYAKIAAGETVCRNAIYTVPAGKTLYVASALFGVGITNAAAVTEYGKVIVQATQLSGALKAGVFYPAFELIASNGSQYIHFDEPLKFVEKVDIKVSAIGSATTGTVANAVLRGFLK